MRGLERFVIPPMLLVLSHSALATGSTYRDRSPHRVRMVEVSSDVRLETLDWGGSGAPIVLLAGLGGTAHVYDDLAEKLCRNFHVYGVTRRGFGKSGMPADGYDTDQLADDDLRVLDALKLQSAVLVGHSIAGLELSALAARHPERVAGLVYLDTTHLYDKGDDDLLGVAEWHQHLKALRDSLDKLESSPNAPIPVARQLLDSDWPAFQRDLEDLILAEKARPPFRAPGAEDKASFPAFQKWFASVQRFRPPESELREQFIAGPHGEVGEWKSPPWVSEKILAGQKKYSGIRKPTLAIFAVRSTTRSPLPEDEESRRAADTYVKIATARAERRANAFKHDMPGAEIVFLQRAPHFIFLSHEADVLREISSFVSGLAGLARSAR